MAQILGMKGLIFGHGEQVKARLLAVAEKEILADAHAQRARHSGADFHGLRLFMLNALIRDVQGIEQRIACHRALGGMLRRSVVEGGYQHAYASSFSFSSFSPAL